AGGEGQSEAKPPTPAWPFVILAAVFVVVLGVGASLGVRHFLVPEPDPIETSQINVPTQKPKAPGEATSIDLQIITRGEGTEPGMVRVTWEPPEGAAQDDYFQVRWKDVPEGYEAKYGGWREAYGRNSITLKIPPKLPEQCIEVRTVNPNGLASAPVKKCLPTE
ncbi:MAG: serine/threonine protein kinase, partial [Brachybacterium sp.]|nr:serine/threonine protein kinase [Brachybacterium sp.]